MKNKFLQLLAEYGMSDQEREKREEKQKQEKRNKMKYFKNNIET